MNISSSRKQTQKLNGFTLIEILVITGITVVVLLTAVSFFMTFLINQAKITQRQQLKNAGESLLKQMTQVLREAQGIEPCSTNMNSLLFSTVNNNQAGYSLSSNQIFYTLEGDSFSITPEDMVVGSFIANCYPTQDSQLVKVTISLTNPKIQGPSGKPLTQEFSTSVQLRN